MRFLQYLLESYQANIDKEIKSFLDAARQDAKKRSTDSLSSFIDAMTTEMKQLEIERRQLDHEDPNKELIATESGHIEQLINFADDLINDGKIHIAGLYAGNDGYDLLMFDRPYLDELKDEVYGWINHSLLQKRYERDND